MNISESEFGKITESFNYADFYNVIAGNLNDCITMLDYFINSKEKNAMEIYINKVLTLKKIIKEILEDEDKLNKYVALTLTWWVDMSIDELFYFKNYPKKEFTIHCIDGHTYTFSNEDLDVFKNNSLETIRKFIYEKAGLEYTPLDKIIYISDPVEKRRMFKYNGYESPYLPHVHDFNIDLDLDDLIKRTNITSYANLGTEYTASK